MLPDICRTDCSVILYQVVFDFNERRSFLKGMGFTIAGSLAEAHPTTVIAAILTGKTALAGMLLTASGRRLWDIYFTL